MSSAEAAEMSKLADTTYRDVNIAFANELARYADRIGVDVLEVIRAANSQPYSHIHQPGLGVGGHCIPVYPHFLLSRAPEMELVALARRVNDGQVGVAVETLRSRARLARGRAGARPRPHVPRGREGARLLARRSRSSRELAGAGARVSAWDPLLSAEEVAALGAAPWAWGTPSDVRAIVTQTADPAFREIDPAWLPRLEVVLDGRNGLRAILWPDHVRVLGVGVPPRGGAPAVQPVTPLRRTELPRKMRIVSVVGTRPQLDQGCRPVAGAPRTARGRPG